MSFLQTLIIALLAPTGIWIGWFLQRKDKTEDREVQRKEILRLKAEEIYVEMEAVHDRSIASAENAIRDKFNGSMDGELDVKPERLKALIHMYFPDGAAIISAYDTAMYQPICDRSAAFEQVNENTSLSVGEKHAQILEQRVEFAKALSNQTTVFVVKLRSFMNDQVRKLI